jgi:hypothetical protein
MVRLKLGMTQFIDAFVADGMLAYSEFLSSL